MLRNKVLAASIHIEEKVTFEGLFLVENYFLWKCDIVTPPTLKMVYVYSEPPIPPLPYRRPRVSPLPSIFE